MEPAACTDMHPMRTHTIVEAWSNPAYVTLLELCLRSRIRGRVVTVCACVCTCIYACVKDPRRVHAPLDDEKVPLNLKEPVALLQRKINASTHACIYQKTYSHTVCSIEHP